LPLNQTIISFLYAECVFGKNDNIFSIEDVL
jgi:hypothetical protein